MYQPWANEAVIAHTACVVHSYRHFTGRELVPEGGTTDAVARAVFEAPFVLVSHGTEPDPVLNYGNAAALRLWETTWAELTRMPSRLTAEASDREERARLLAQVTRHGFIDDYSGIRISTRGRRFRIAQATVWNLLTPSGEPGGQAAMFSKWKLL